MLWHYMKNVPEIDREDFLLKKNSRNFPVNREMRDEILVYDLFLSKFWAKMVSKCRENAGEIWILGFRC